MCWQLNELCAKVKRRGETTDLLWSVWKGKRDAKGATSSFSIPHQSAGKPSPWVTFTQSLQPKSLPNAPNPSINESSSSSSRSSAGRVLKEASMGFRCRLLHLCLFGFHSFPSPITFIRTRKIARTQVLSPGKSFSLFSTQTIRSVSNFSLSFFLSLPLHAHSPSLFLYAVTPADHFDSRWNHVIVLNWPRLGLAIADL